MTIFSMYGDVKFYRPIDDRNIYINLINIMIYKYINIIYKTNY